MVRRAGRRTRILTKSEGRIGNASGDNPVSAQMLKGRSFRVHRDSHSPGEMRIASVGARSELKIWDSTTGQQLHSFTKPQPFGNSSDRFNCVAFSPRTSSILPAANSQFL